MKVRIVDDEALSTANPRNIRVYLRTRGWLRHAQGRGDIYVLQRNGEEFEVRAPSREFNDFEQQVAVLLHTLSAVEDRSELDVLRDLETASFDVQNVHRQDSGRPGTLLLGEAVRTFGAARKLLKEAAASLDATPEQSERRAAQKDRVNSFLRRVLTGPPEVGSYVVSMWVPMPPRLNTDDDDVLLGDSHEPHERAVTRRLNQSVLAAQAAADRATRGRDGVGVETFLGQESIGLSAELCQSLYELAGKRAAPLDLYFSWALDRPAPGLSGAARFAPQHVEILSDAAAALRRGRLQVEVRGRVSRLAQPHRGGGGDITIEGEVVDDQRRGVVKVRVALERPHYELAVFAHGEESDVTVVGLLVERAGRLYMTETQRFDLVDR